MNFDFSSEQKMLKDQAQKLLADKCGLGAARTILEGDEYFAQDVWKEAVEMGWTGVAIPEEYGGLGLGYLELCIIAEELGRVLAPVPFSSSVCLATEALILAGSEEQKTRYLPGLAAGDLIGTFAVSEGVGVASPSSLKTTLKNGQISGCKMPVADGCIADFVIVAGVEETGGGVSLAIVDLAADGVTREPISVVDPSRGHARIEFKAAAADVLPATTDGWALIEELYNRAAVLMAFEQVGGADACLKMSQEYTKERYAFGRPVGSFQAIKHKLADMFIKNELARSHAYYGAWALSSGADTLPLAAAGARISATKAFEYASRENIQAHGGIGFTWEADCQLFYRRSRLLALSLGSERVWNGRLVDLLAAQASA